MNIEMHRPQRAPSGHAPRRVRFRVAAVALLAGAAACGGGGGAQVVQTSAAVADTAPTPNPTPAPTPTPTPTTGSALLSWNPPTTRADGSVLSNLAGYRVLYGTQPKAYTASLWLANPGLSSYLVENLASGTWYFVVAARDADGYESGPSNEASKTIP